MKIRDWEVIKYRKVTSTMDVAKNFLGRDEKIVILAEEQTEGRGRYGNKWISPKGGLYFSLIVKKNEITDFLSEITAISLIETLNNFNIKDCKIKFPNDIIIKGKKISGILIEQSGNFYIVGVGMNIEQNQNLKKYGYITMEDVLKTKINIEDVLLSFIKNFDTTSDLFKKNYELGIKRWSENLIK
ncbi:MAG: biotin--[acetyl-CoA-carboxylase] ligase [Candidatus Omnitrophica bacterium]|nr:biotin--[acetyl-CoA-carboxylase] ligase [Candidatus Omnitrophota bacterium]